MKLDFIASALFAAGCAAFASCDPQAFTMNVEMRYPSSSKLALDGKSVAVVYLDSDVGRDSVFNEYLAGGFASSLEKDYFGGEVVVDLFRIVQRAGVDYSVPDSLRSLVMQTGDDVVFLFSAPEFGETGISEVQKSASGDSLYHTVSLPVKIQLFAYDSMNKADSVMSWQGSRKIVKPVPYSGDGTSDVTDNAFWQSLGTQGEQLGKASARIFRPSWQEEQFTFIYFDSPEAWNKASEAAYSFKWQDAVSEWMKLLDTGNPMRRSCAEYNIAVACFLNGEGRLALEWLDRSDADFPVSLSSSLRKRIEAWLQVSSK